MTSRNDAIAFAQRQLDSGEFMQTLARRIAIPTESQNPERGAVLAYPGCSQHAPNEHLPPELLREALAVMTGLYWDMRAGGTPKASA